jgi:hypothetical protein
MRERENEVSIDCTKALITCGMHNKTKKEHVGGVKNTDASHGKEQDPIRGSRGKGVLNSQVGSRGRKIPTIVIGIRYLETEM